MQLKLYSTSIISSQIYKGTVAAEWSNAFAIPMKAYEIPESGRTARGTAIVNLLQLLPEERITAIIPLKEYKDDRFLFMATQNGIVKKAPIKDYEHIRKSGLQAISLREDDELIEVKSTNRLKDIFLVTKMVCASDLTNEM